MELKDGFIIINSKASFQTPFPPSNFSTFQMKVTKKLSLPRNFFHSKSIKVVKMSTIKNVTVVGVS
jgi:hypothetical protein